MNDEKNMTNTEETKGTPNADAATDLTTEELLEAKQTGEKLAESVIGITEDLAETAADITDEDLLRKREEIHEKFDTAFGILFGDNYSVLERADMTFECDDKRFYVSLSPAIGSL